MPPSFPFLGPVAWAVCLGVASAQADLLDIALTAAAADGVQPVLPLAPRLKQRTEVATEAALVAAVRVPGNDVVLTQDIALTGDLVLEADDVRLRGRHALVGGAIRFSRSLERVALEEFTAPRIAWDGPFAFDDALGEVICPWSVRATDVSIVVESAPRVSGAAWQSEGVYVEPEPLTAQTTLLRAHVPFRPGESQRFMRLRLVRY